MSAVSKFPASVLPILTLALVAGCRSTPPATRLGIPAEDRVRVLATTVAETDAKRHWKWSVLAGRNWETPRIEGTTASLAGGYPLNAAMRSGGCHTWEVDLVAEHRDGAWEWSLEVHGSNGRTAKATGRSERVERVSTTETETGLPADLRLARIDDNPVDLKLPR